MKNLYFVRHGLSEMNIHGKYAGSSETPLTHIGREQAKNAGLHLKRNGIDVDIIISSPMSRTLETARHIASEINYELEHILTHNGLIERHFGNLEGTYSKNSLVDRETALADPYALDYVDGIEKIDTLQQRANKLFHELRSMPYDTVLLVSHGAFGRALYRAIHDLPIENPGIQFRNAEIVKLI
jgi:probable phosphoglycerate mutase